MKSKCLPVILCVLFASPPEVTEGRALPADGIRSFLYQLQNISLKDIRESGFDLVILDYSADGTDEAAFSAAEIDGLKTGPSGDKIVLSYLSIGEAEDYRFYWQSGWKPGNPSWLDAQNPEWAGNYKVRFWEDGWRTIVSGYLDKIIDAGFDGIYCDIIDAYEYYNENGRTAAAREMADFVSAICSHARSRDPEFLIFVQNAAELAAEVPSYLDAVDGIGQEDIYYGYEGDGKATPADVTSSLEAVLALYRDAGKPVLTVDYPFSSSEDIPRYDALTRIKIDKAYSRSRAHGFIPYCSVRNLDFLTVNPGHEPAAVKQSPSSEQPGEFALLSNYPNPFNGGTVITFRTEGPAKVRLKIFDALGREVAVLSQGLVGAGIHECRWDGRDSHGAEAAAGLYLARLQIGGMSSGRKMALIR
jgi:cysteinyl-tRNA synthetase, unknown class